LADDNKLIRGRVALLIPLVLLILMAGFEFTSAEAVPIRGKQLFEKRCTGCHSLDRNKEGPSLGNVFGRASGTAPDFNYSPALKASHFVWNEHQLDRWLTDTQSVVEDNNMDFHVASAEERAEIIGYLKAISPAQGNTASAIR